MLNFKSVIRAQRRSPFINSLKSAHRSWPPSCVPEPCAAMRPRHGFAELEAPDRGLLLHAKRSSDLFLQPARPGTSGRFIYLTSPPLPFAFLCWLALALAPCTSPVSGVPASRSPPPLNARFSRAAGRPAGPRAPLALALQLHLPPTTTSSVADGHWQGDMEPVPSLLAFLITHL